MTKSRRLDGAVEAIDLFCGAGGLTFGLARAGINVRVGYDLDPACEAPYRLNNTSEFIRADIAALTGKIIRKHLHHDGPFLLAGCAPCQPFSRYSKTGRGRTERDRWKLVLEFGRLVRESEPDFVTMENVPMLASHKAFADFKTSLKGYEVWAEVVDSSHFGCAQSRKRLVLLASRHGKIELRPPLTNRLQTVRSVISKLSPIAAGEPNPKDSMHVAAALSTRNLARIQASRPGGTWRDWPVSLRAECHRRPGGATYPAVYGRMEWDKLAPTMTTQCYGYGNGRFGHPTQDRAITLREAAMFQGFPRTYKFVQGNQAACFLSLGRLIGNAVPVPLARAIG